MALAVALAAGGGAVSASAAPATSTVETPADGGHSMGWSMPAGPQVAAPSVRSRDAAAASGGSSLPVQGMDVSSYNGDVDWAAAKNAGKQFAFVKASEGTTITNENFTQQWTGSATLGYHGAYAVGSPGISSGTSQADYFVKQVEAGARVTSWSALGAVLPPVLDLENGATTECWNLTQAQMVAWIQSYAVEILAKTGQNVSIYSNPSWWSDCTGNSGGFGISPLYIARYTTAATPNPLPSSWSAWSFWQYEKPTGNASPTSYDFDAFNGNISQLASMTTTSAASRLAGTNRFATSADLSASTFSPFAAGQGTVYIASGLSYPDALAGGALAGHLDSPVLLVTSTAVPPATQAELTRLDPARIVILGGTTVITPAVQTALQQYTQAQSAPFVTRLAGSNRFVTSADIATGFTTTGGVVYLATGLAYPDALSGAAVAAESGAHSGPLMLVAPNGISTAVAAQLTRLKPSKIILLGGTSAVSTTVASQAAKYAPTVTRFAGTTRYNTSALISSSTFPSSTPPTTVYIAVGTNFPDALSGAPVAGLADSPVLLVTSTGIPTLVAQELHRLKPQSIVVLGGTSAISTEVEAQLDGLAR
ncbi:hypothetical protein AX769_18115 [Frondihabitans sp. PAMC 28766]|nr:hypothetical protein AX769_18115 [Frondihabitans sp. PAMC 28766]